MENRLFSIPFYHFSQENLKKIREEVQRTNKEQLQDPIPFASSLLSRYTLIKLNIDWDSLKVLPNHREEEIHHRDVFGDEVRTVTPVYSFEVEYSGSPVLFSVQPSQSRVMRFEARVDDGKLLFEIHGSDSQRLNQIKEGVCFNLENQQREVEAYNTELKDVVNEAIDRRNQELKAQDKGLSAFGVPIKSDES